jgi:thioesterase domain-containing protein
VVRPSSGRGAVYIVHPGSLPHSAYQPLFDALPPDASVVMLDLDRVEEYWQAALLGAAIEITVEEIAERFAREMTRGEQADKFVLIGWSFGGVIAHAMVARLPAGRGPERLLLLDSIAPVPEFTPAESDLGTEMLLSWFAMYLGAKRGTEFPVRQDVLERRTLDDALEDLLEAAIANDTLHPDTTLPGFKKLYSTYVEGLLRNNRLAQKYQAQPTSVPITLVKPQQSLLPDSPTLGWDALAAGDFRVERCPGNHYTMISSLVAVDKVAQLVSDELPKGA